SGGEGRGEGAISEDRSPQFHASTSVRRRGRCPPSPRPSPPERGGRESLLRLGARVPNLSPAIREGGTCEALWILALVGGLSGPHSAQLEGVGCEQSFVHLR